MRYPSNLISCTHSGVLGALLVKVASDGGTNSGNLARRAPGIAEATPAKSSSLVFCFFVALAAGFAFAVRARAAGFALGADFAAGAAGFAWVPLPFVCTPEDDARLRRAAPAAAGIIAAVLIGLTAWLDVPVTRALAIAALIMAASMLTPIKPLDGAAIAKAGAVGASVAAVGLGALALFGIG